MFLLRFWLRQPMYTLLSIKTDIKYEISAPDLPRTHKMMSNLAAVRRKPETRKPATGATRSLFKSIHFSYEKVTLIFQCRIRNGICNYGFQNNYSVKSRQINFSRKAVQLASLEYDISLKSF